MSRVCTPLEERLLEKIELNDDGCWLYTGCLTRDGYGKITMQGRKTALVHRVAYELFVGNIPAGLQIDHLCRVRHCFNPAHLDCVTNQENVRRGILAGNNHGGHRNPVSHCPEGHPYDGQNTIWAVIRHYADGSKQWARRCRTCRRAQDRKYKARRRLTGRGVK